MEFDYLKKSWKIFLKQVGSVILVKNLPPELKNLDFCQR